MSRRAQAGEDGFVLVSVVRVLAAVSALLATAILQARASAVLARTRADLLQLQGPADGIARLIAYDLAVGRTYRLAGLSLPEDGSVVACPLAEERTAYLSVEDQGRLIDLNRTPRPALEEAFRALGVPDRAALALGAEIVDHQDPDDIPEPNGGAELAQYRARFLPYGPRNAPFLSVDEIGRLPSMTAEISARLQPALTDYNEGGTFDRAALVQRLQPAAAPALAGESRPVPSPRQYFRLSVTVMHGDVRAGRRGVYALGGTRTGTDFLVWQPGVTDRLAPAADHPACPAIRAALAGPIYANYALIDATFQFNQTLSSPNNPLAGTGASGGATNGDLIPNGGIRVRPGDKIPLIPDHQIKAGFEYTITPNWRFGLNVSAFSSSYFRGDESNLNRKLPAYYVMNLTKYQVTKNLEIFGLITNLTNQRYTTFGTFVEPGAVAGNLSINDPRTTTLAQPLSVYAGQTYRSGADPVPMSPEPIIRKY